MAVPMRPHGLADVAVCETASVCMMMMAALVVEVVEAV